MQEDAALDVLGEFFGKFGGKGLFFVYHQDDCAISRPEARILTSIAPDWMDRYIEKGYLENDPIHMQCMRTRSPVFWGDILESELSGEARKICGEAGEHGFRQGVSALFHRPDGNTGALSVVLDGKAVEARRMFSAFGRVMSLLAVYAHTALTTNRKAIARAQTSLSRREVDCLSYAARGMTAKQIAYHLGISEPTVAFHFASARRKLGAATATQAVAKAVWMDLIQP